MLSLLAFDVANAAKSVLGIGALIFVHELGHFLVGRVCRVKAEAFSIGFGPVLAKWKPGETEYRLSAIPLGGYVKFLGENPDERGDRDPRSFFAATYPRKVAIMLAGVTMNVVAAFLLFVAAFSAGVSVLPPVIGSMRPGYPAWEQGLQSGDRIVSVDGHRIVDFIDVAQDCALAGSVELTIERDGKRLPPLRIATHLGADGVHYLGISPPIEDDGVLHQAPDGTPLAAGLADGDRVVAVDGVPVKSIAEAVAEQAKATERDAVWTVERAGARVDVTVPPQKRWVLGVALDGTNLAVQAASAAHAAGFRTGDVPVSVADAATPTVTAFLTALDGAKAGTDVVVRRAAGDVRLRIDAAPAEVVKGLWFTPPADVVVSVPSDPAESPAAQAGVTTGSVITRIDGNDVHGFDELRAAVAEAGQGGRPLRLSWRAPDGTAHDDVEVRPAHVADPAATSLGIGLRSATEPVHEPNVLAAAALGLDRTHRWVTRILGTLRSLVTGGVSAKKLHGPLQIARDTYDSADSGWPALFLFLGMISMNLAVLNVLPVPLLDGGQLALITAEKVRGKPLPESLLEGIQWTGLLLLLSFMLFVIVNDIRNL